MQSEGKIVSVRYEHEMINGRICGQSHIFATFEDGSEVKIISYYTDELSFPEDQLIGLTEQNAMDLWRKKDINYLQS